MKIHPTVSISRVRLWRGDKDAGGTPTNIPVHPAIIEEQHEDGLQPERKEKMRGDISTAIAVRNVRSTKRPTKIIRREYLITWMGDKGENAEWKNKTWIGAEETARFEATEDYMDNTPSVYKSK